MSRRRHGAQARTAAVAAFVGGLSLAVADPAGALVRSSAPVEPSRDTARTWAAEELSGREYQQARPGLLSRALTWLWEQLDRLPTFTGTGSQIAVLVVVLAVLLAVLFAVYRSGGLRRQSRVGEEPVFGDRTLSAADHRAAAESAEQAEDWATAVVERFRAVVRELEERAVLVPQPGRTADEVAADAGAWLPAFAQQLRNAATVFDDVRYGDRHAEPSTVAVLRELDDAVRRAKPVAQAVAVTGGLVAPS